MSGFYGTFGGRKVYYSTRFNKKLMVKVNGKWIHFGHPAYEDYTDHGDKDRRWNYLRRSAHIRNKQGTLTRNDPESPNYWARRVLWKSREGYK
mgnify:CR=1 FL=1